MSDDYENAVFRNRRRREWVAIPEKLDDIGLDIAPYRAYCHLAVLAELGKSTDDLEASVAHKGRMSKQEAADALAELERRKIITRWTDENGEHHVDLNDERDWE